MLGSTIQSSGRAGSVDGFIVERERLDDLFQPEMILCKVPVWHSGCK